MNRLLLIVLFSLSLCYSSYGQKFQGKDSSIVITYFGNKSPFRDSVFLANLSKTYGDSGKILLNRLLKDTAFINKFDNAFLMANGEFVSSTYKIRLPAKYLGCVSDYEHTFSKKQKAALNSLINNFNRSHSVNIAIITIDSAWTTKNNFDDLIKTIHHNWGSENIKISNGILIGLSKSLRVMRVDNGAGVTNKFSDETAKKIIDEIFIPAYKQNNYFTGTKSGLLAIMKKLR